MNLKYCFKSLTIGLTSASLVVGCSPSTTASLAQVSSSFKMTGSSSAATVAKHSPRNFLDILLNQAHAFVPTNLVDSTGLSISLSQAWTVVKEVEFKSDTWACRGCTTGSASGCVCWLLRRAPRPRASARWARRWPGATRCCRRLNKQRCAGWR